MSLTVETAFGAAGGAVLQRILRTLLHTHVNALAVSDVYRGAVGICQRQTIQRHCALGTSSECQRTVVRGSVEVICYLLHSAIVDEVVGNGIALCYGYVRSTYGDVNILCYVACYKHQGSCTIIGDVDLVVADLAVVSKHRSDATKGEGSAHYRHR